MSNSTIAKHYTRLLSLWPKDLLRPNQPFTRAIESRSALYGVASPHPAPESSKSKPDTKSRTTKVVADHKLDQANINALYSLLENRYAKRYPTSPGVLKPTSNPEYYDRLMEEIERAPTKTWLQAKMDEWKMKIRWK